jgi:uncharacterized membrane protein YdjX (TVP38/TMEM64 family)
MKFPFRKIFYATLLIVTMAGAYFMLINSGFANLFSDLDLLVMRIRELGILGPYGHVVGTIYIVTGAGVGAIIAFAIARFAGHELARKFLGNNLSLGRLGSQNALTTIVFVSRLIPFMSFDLVSYAAGLTAIKLWRFTLATLLGLMPVSFILAHMGSEIVESSRGDVIVIILIIGLFTLVPLLINAVQRYRHRHQLNDPEQPL